MEERLPFAREGQQTGISPTSAIVPAGAHVPAGTLVSIRLKSSISSATANAGDTFEAVLAEPIVVNGQVLAERGAPVSGRVMEARAASPSDPAGYLRLALSSIELRGQTSSARSSSSFVKAASLRKRDVALRRSAPGRDVLIDASAPGENAYSMGRVSSGGTSTAGGSEGPMDVIVGPERRLTFRLTEPIPIAD